MPQYEFECIHCANKIEIVQKVHDSVPICKFCDKEMKKLIGKTNFILRGEGWGKDLYCKRPIKK